MKITLTNDFHNTKVVLVTRKNSPSRISESQRKKAKRTLCGIGGCTCSGPFGDRGHQTTQIQEEWNYRKGTYDGGTIIDY